MFNVITDGRRRDKVFLRGRFALRKKLLFVLFPQMITFVYIYVHMYAFYSIIFKQLENTNTKNAITIITA